MRAVIRSARFCSDERIAPRLEASRRWRTVRASATAVPRRPAAAPRNCWMYAVTGS